LTSFPNAAAFVFFYIQLLQLLLVLCSFTDHLTDVSMHLNFDHEASNALPEFL